jgi:sugar lactone lactonase YvrE
MQRALIGSVWAAMGMLFLAASCSALDCTLCFYGPDNMAVDSDGNVFIVDTDHHARSRVLKVSRSGAKIVEWSGFINTAGSSNGPEGIALAPSGEWLVTDGGARNIVVLSRDLRFLRLIGSASIFHDFGHVTVDSKGQIFVAEGEQNRISKFAADGTSTATWQMDKGNGPTELNTPQGIGSLPDGRLAIEDWRNRRIVILDTGEGALLSNFGGAGRAPGQLQNSSSMYVDRQGNILVAEQQLHRIQKFTPQGHLLSVISNSANRHLFTEGPTAIASGATGTLFAPDGLSIVKISPDGQLLARWD